MRVGLLGAVVLATALIALCCTAAGEQPQCSGHGKPDGSGHCVCDAPWPEAGAKGFAGANCSIPVFGVGAPDGGDVTARCASDGCNSLDPGHWVCFASHFPWNSTSGPDWRHLSVQLNRTSADPKGDPDFFGLWYGGERGAAPSTSGRGYDFQDTSSSLHPTVTKTVAKADFGAAANYSGAYLCVRAYGRVATTFALRASLDPCPSTFGPDGALLMCHTRRDAAEAERRFDACTPAGECACRPPYARPVPEVYPNLGFEDCSAEVVRVNGSAFEGNASFVAAHERALPGHWRYYAVRLHEGDRQLVVTLAQESGAGGTLDLYLKAGQPPGYGARQYDLRPAWNAASGDKALEIALDASHPAYRPGDWYIGVPGDDNVPANYTLTISKYQCPYACSGHGECVPGEGADAAPACSCEDGYGGADCSKSSAALGFGETVSRGPLSFEYEYYSLPEPTPGSKTGLVEVSVEASFESEGFGKWMMDVRPVVLLARSEGGAGYPTASNFSHRLTLDQQRLVRSLTLCPSELAAGGWRLAVYNPLRMVPMSYNLTLRKEGRCLGDCSGHGTCNSDGVCECSDNWAGGDCSVSVTAECPVGARRAVPRSDDHGTCWQECRCDAAGKDCSFGPDCAGFVCDDAAPGEVPWRLQALGATTCVRDACDRDLWVQTKDYVCLRNCTCPPDGAPCALERYCGLKVDIRGGGKEHHKRHGIGGAAFFFWMLVFLAAGGAAALGFIHMRGVPAWLPIRSRGFGGLYQELSEHEGI